MKFETQNSRIGLYLVLTLALSCIFYALIITNGHVDGGGGLYVTGVMWCPAISALLTCRIAGLDYSILGWNWGNTRWELTGFLIPLGYATVAYLIIWTTGLGVFGNKHFESGLAKAFGWGNAPSFVVVAGYFVLNGIFGMAGSVATALGEEIGWRGFLAPHLDRKFGFTGGVLATGAIWALWHTRPSVRRLQHGDTMVVQSSMFCRTGDEHQLPACVAAAQITQRVARCGIACEPQSVHTEFLYSDDEPEWQDYTVRD